MWLTCVSQDQDALRRAVWESHEKPSQGPSFPWLESCIKIQTPTPVFCLSFTVRHCLVTWNKWEQHEPLPQGPRSSPLNYCQEHRAEVWQWNLWQLKPWFCWKEACILNIQCQEALSKPTILYPVVSGKGEKDRYVHKKQEPWAKKEDP